MYVIARRNEYLCTRVICVDWYRARERDSTGEPFYFYYGLHRGTVRERTSKKRVDNVQSENETYNMIREQRRQRSV